MLATIYYVLWKFIKNSGIKYYLAIILYSTQEKVHKGRSLIWLVMKMKVILLNYDYSYLNSLSVQKAMRLMAKGKVTVEKYSEKAINTITKKVLVPLILRLVYLVRKIYRKALAWSKKNVMARDDYQCVYCGATDKLNIDHVFPQSRGGKSSFENTVTSCIKCNNKKGGRTLAEANMFYWKRSYRPYQPTVMEFMQKHLNSSGVLELLEEAGLYK